MAPRELRPYLLEERLDPEPIASSQRKSMWCWAACCEMLAASQGVYVSQDWFVERVFGPQLPNWPTGGSFAPISRALEGIFETEDGGETYLSSAFHYGVPTNPWGMVESIEEGRPFILAWNGHAYVCYGLQYHEVPNFRVVALYLIDPAWEQFGTKKYRVFSVFHHSANRIDGTLELLVD